MAVETIEITGARARSGNSGVSARAALASVAFAVPRALGLDNLAAVRDARVERAWGWLPIGVMVTFLAAAMLEPAPANPGQAGLLDALMSLGLFGAVALTMVAASQGFKGARLGLVLALPATLFLLFATVTCPVSGHHTWGAWVAGTWGLGGAATAAHFVALARTRPR